MAAAAPGQAASSAEATKRRLEELLKPGGRWIGDKGSNARIREVRKAGLSDARKLFDQLSAGGTQVTGTTYPGTLVRLPYVGYIGLRPISESGPPTVDVRAPGFNVTEIKFLP